MTNVWDSNDACIRNEPLYEIGVSGRYQPIFLSLNHDGWNNQATQFRPQLLQLPFEREDLLIRIDQGRREVDS